MTPQEMMQMWTQMNGQQQQQPQQAPDLAGIIQALRAPKQSLHLGMGGAPITADNPGGSAGGDPFTNGFFKDSNQRIGVESSRLGDGQFGAEGVAAGLAPQQVNPLAMFNFPQGQVLPEQPYQQASYLPGTPMQGMINPALPDAQKYQDANFWSAIPSVNPRGWMPGQHAR